MKKYLLLVVFLFIAGNAFAQSVVGAPNNGVIDNGPRYSNAASGPSKPKTAPVATTYTTTSDYEVKDDQAKEVQIGQKVFENKNGIAKLVCDTNILLGVGKKEEVRACKDVRFKIKLQLVGRTEGTFLLQTLIDAKTNQVILLLDRNNSPATTKESFVLQWEPTAHYGHEWCN